MPEGWRPKEEPIIQFESKSRKNKNNNNNSCFSLKAVRLKKFPLTCRMVSFFVLFSPSTDWTRPICIRKCSLLYSDY